jgi:diguanylate cyclase (GGDEF)-like protein
MIGRLGTRSRILLLIAASVLPPILLSVYVIGEQRQAAEAVARENIEVRAELASALLAGAKGQPWDLRPPVRLGAHEVLSLFDAQGVLLAQYPAATSASAAPEPALLGRMMLTPHAVLEGADRSGERRLFAAVSASASGSGAARWTIVSVPKRIVYERLDRGLMQLLSGTAAATLILVLVGLYAAERDVLRSIRALLKMARRVRSGDLSARTALSHADDELSQLGAALDDMAQQLQNREVQLHSALDELRDQAMTDSLTGLYNRRYFWDALTRNVLSSRRKGTPFSVILLDVDHFKRVNDSRGHDAGDLVLNAIAAVIVSCVRASDIAVRYGGEEFSILLPDTGLGIAEERAQALRLAIEHLEIPHAAGAINVTASFGVAEYDDVAESGNALMKRVDAAMYAAKSGGRNRVIVSSAHACAARASLDAQMRLHAPLI